MNVTVLYCDVWTPFKFYFDLLLGERTTRRGRHGLMEVCREYQLSTLIKKVQQKSNNTGRFGLEFPQLHRRNGVKFVSIKGKKVS